MRKFKTAEKNRTNYVYYTAAGKAITIKPGMVGDDKKPASEEMITLLHTWDDDQVDADRRELYHCPVHYQAYADAAVYNSASQNLMVEEQELKDRKEELMNNIGGDKTKVRELQTLMDFTSKGEMLTEFDEKLFTAFVEKIIVQSRDEITFRLKCGLKLKERLVKADAT